MKIKKFYAFISILLADCYHTQKAASLSDAKVRKYVFQDIVGSYFAGDGAEVVDGKADILAQKIGRDAVIHRRPPPETPLPANGPRSAPPWCQRR